jgi:hypothetical protein
MIRLMGTLPVRTRLPLTAWVIAGVSTLASAVSSLVHAASAGGGSAMAELAHHASVADLLGFLRASLCG